MTLMMPIGTPSFISGTNSMLRKPRSRAISLIGACATISVSEIGERPAMLGQSRTARYSIDRSGEIRPAVLRRQPD